MSSIFALFLGLLCILFICNELYTAGNKHTNALTNADRLDYLKTAGYTVLCDKPAVKVVTIPQKFLDIYNNYNILQLTSGYDLSLYKGCEVTIYSYKIDAPNGYSGECLANVIVYNNRIIGGDVSSVCLGEFMLPLK